MMLSALSFIALFALTAGQDDRIELPAVMPEKQEGRTPIAPLLEEPTLVIYDVRDLIEFDRSLGESEESVDAEGRKRKLMAETEAFAAFLADHVEPALSTSQGTTETVRAAGVGSVIVMGRPGQHAWVERVLTLHRSKQYLMHVRVKYVQGPRGAFDEYGKGGTVSFLETDEELQTFLRLAEGPGMETVIAPQIVAFNRQLCTVQVMKQVAYVKEYRLIVVEPGAQEIADPIVDTVQEGYSVEVRAGLLEEGLHALDIELTRAQIQRPILTKKMRLSPAIHSEVEVSTPVCLTSTIQSKLVVAENTAVVFLSPSNEEGRDLACVLTVETITPQALDAFPAPQDGQGERVQELGYVGDGDEDD